MRAARCAIGPMAEDVSFRKPLSGPTTGASATYSSPAGIAPDAPTRAAKSCDQRSSCAGLCKLQRLDRGERQRHVRRFRARQPMKVQRPLTWNSRHEFDPRATPLGNRLESVSGRLLFLRALSRLGTDAAVRLTRLQIRRERVVTDAQGTLAASRLLP